MKIITVNSESITATHAWFDASLSDADIVAYYTKNTKSLRCIDFEVLRVERNRQLLHVYILPYAIFKKLCHQHKIYYLRPCVIEMDLHSLGRALAHQLRLKLSCIRMMCIVIYEEKVTLSVYHNNVLEFFIHKNINVFEEGISIQSRLHLIVVWYAHWKESGRIDRIVIVCFDDSLLEINWQEEFRWHAGCSVVRAASYEQLISQGIKLRGGL